MSGPCLFCGSPDTSLSEVSPKLWAVCCPCGAQGTTFRSRIRAANAWRLLARRLKRRPAPARVQPGAQARSIAVIHHARAIADLYDDGGER